MASKRIDFREISKEDFITLLFEEGEEEIKNFFPLKDEYSEEELLRIGQDIIYAFEYSKYYTFIPQSRITAFCFGRLSLEETKVEVEAELEKEFNLSAYPNNWLNAFSMVKRTPEKYMKLAKDYIEYCKRQLKLGEQLLDQQANHFIFTFTMN